MRFHPENHLVSQHHKVSIILSIDINITHHRPTFPLVISITHINIDVLLRLSSLSFASHLDMFYVNQLALLNESCLLLLLHLLHPARCWCCLCSCNCCSRFCLIVCCKCSCCRFSYCCGSRCLCSCSCGTGPFLLQCLLQLFVLWLQLLLPLQLPLLLQLLLPLLLWFLL